MRFPPAFQVHAQTLHLLPLSALRPKCFPTKRVLAIKIRPGVLTGLAPKFSLSVSNGDIFGQASYNRDKFILLVTIFFFKRNGEKISVWLSQIFTESYWQMPKCLCQCCAFGICQNYDQGCGADVTRSGSNYKISLGWVYGPQYHVILARFFFFVFFCFCFFEKQSYRYKSSIISLAQCIKLQKPLQSITVVRIKVALLSIPVS